MKKKKKTRKKLPTSLLCKCKFIACLFKSMCTMGSLSVEREPVACVALDLVSGFHRVFLADLVYGRPIFGSLSPSLTLSLALPASQWQNSIPYRTHHTTHVHRTNGSSICHLFCAQPNKIN